MKPAGSAVYQEAVGEKLTRTGADTLLLLERLPGTLPFLTFLESLRYSFPRVRIIVIVKERPKGSPFLQAVTDLGIYDILNKNPNLEELEEIILHPRTFQDAAVYRNPAVFGEPPELTESREPEASDEEAVPFETVVRKEPETGMFRRFLGSLPKREKREKKEKEAKKEKEPKERKEPPGDPKPESSASEEQTQSEPEPGEPFAKRLQSEHDGEPNVQKNDRKEAVSGEPIRDRTGDFAPPLGGESLREEEENKASVFPGPNPFREEREVLQKRIRRLEASRREQSEALMRLKARESDFLEEILRLENRTTDCSMPPYEVPLYEADLFGESGGITLFLGMGHGVGTTTLSMNCAAGLAAQGEKTLLLELGNPYPMLNAFFELTAIPYGFLEAVEDRKRGGFDAPGRAILRPGSLQAGKRKLWQAYRKLPEGFHLMLYSNRSLVSGIAETEAYVTPSMLHMFFRDLKTRYGYRQILVDCKMESPLFSALLDSDVPIRRTVGVLTQDPHHLMQCGLFIRKLAKRPEGKRPVTFVLNRYRSDCGIPVGQIRRMLHLRAGTPELFPSVEEAFLRASSRGVPLILEDGTARMDLDRLQKKLFDCWEE